MAIEPTFEHQERLADTWQRAHDRMSSRERVAELLLAAGFVAAVAALWTVRAPHAFAITPAAICVLVLVPASLVLIDTPFGFTVPTQLAYVPLLFATPVAVAPIAVALGLALARLPEVFRGRMRPSRLLLTPANAWFAIGPAAVFAIARVSPPHAGAWLLIAALGAQFAVDFTISAVRFSIDRQASFSEQLRDSWVYGFDAALSGIGLLVAEKVNSSPAAPAALLGVIGVLAVLAKERRQRLQGLLELNNTYRGTALALGNIVKVDDTYTGEHSEGVVALTMTVAARVGLSAERRRNLEFAALLHDIGKVAVPKEIINKPGKLDPHEWAIIKTHTIEGQKVLDQIGGFMHDVGLIVRSHHERWDGQGYPDGLAGTAIPLEARIIACCDTWNAMRTDRSYRRALSHEVAVAELTGNTGSQFDPEIVAAVLEVVDPAREREPAIALTPRPALEVS